MSLAFIAPVVQPVNIPHAAAHIARRADETYESTMKRMGDYAQKLMELNKSVPACMTDKENLDRGIKFEECKKLHSFSEKLGRCGLTEFEDEYLGEMKCTCNIMADREMLDRTKPCAEKICSAEDLEKVLEISTKVYNLHFEQCNGAFKTLASFLKKGFTATIEGQVTTFPPNTDFPSTAWDFLTAEPTVTPVAEDGSTPTENGGSRITDAAGEGGSANDTSSAGKMSVGKLAMLGLMVMPVFNVLFM